MKIAYRPGNTWGLTVVETDLDLEPDEHGRRLSDRLVCMAVTPADARIIAEALTERAKGSWTMGNAESRRG